MPDSANQAPKGWQELQVPSRRQCPKLFYFLETKPTSLTLFLTDLISLWESSLGEEGILFEAARQHTSVDPSVSRDQFQVLLAKIGKALSDGGQNVLVREGPKSAPALFLRTSVDLPRPLRPLRWTFQLTLQPASELAERILRPSLHEVAISERKIGSLMQLVRDRDHVISRLLDRIGTSSLDLGLIFPGVAGTRKGAAAVSVADAKKHVPGMVGFDERQWARQFAVDDDADELADRTGLSNLVRGCEKCFAHTKAEHEEWIDDLSSSDRLDQKGRRNQPDRGAKKAALRRPSPQGRSTASSDDFERQATPEHLRQKSPPANRKTREQGSVQADTDEEEPPSKHSRTTKIGGLGRRNATKSFGNAERRWRSSSPAESDQGKASPPARRPSNASTSTVTATDTASESETNGRENPTETSSKKQDTPNNDTAGSAQKRRLGTLRNKRRRTDPSPSASSRSSSRAPSPVATPPHKEPGRRPATLSADSSASDLDLDGPSGPATPASHRLGRLNRGAAAATPTKDGSSSPDDRTHKPSPTSAAATPSRRLGRLGGRKQQQQQPEAEPSPAKSSRKNLPQGQTRLHDEETGSTSTDTPSPSPSATKSKNKPTSRERPSRHATSPPPTNVKSKSRRTEKTETPRAAEEEETAEAKADRRRQELKRTIAANTGAKKKRRF